MSLRRQLLLVSLLLLSLPWAGCQFVREMEGALRQGQEQSLQATSQAVAAVLDDKPQLLYPNTERLSATTDTRTSLIASPSEEPVIVDGYGDGWDGGEPLRFVSQANNSSLAVSYQGVTRNGRLYLLLKVDDPTVIYHNPGLSREPNGDRLLLRTWQHNRRQDYVIATAAPGRVRARYASPIIPGTDAGRIRGHWQDSERGYTLELEMPLSATGGRLGFYITNATGKPGQKFETLGNITPLEMAPPPWLIYTPAALQQTIAAFNRDGRQIGVVDKFHWRIADGGTASATTSDPGADSRKTFWLLRLLYRSILSREGLKPTTPAPQFARAEGAEIDGALSGTASSMRYHDPSDANRTVLSIASPILNGGEVMGAVLIRQSSEEYLSLTDRAFSSLLGYGLAAISLCVLGLLGYASILSWRIRALSTATTGVDLDDGVNLDNFPQSTATDEIGELSRSYANLLHRLQQNNSYLRTLSRKLSHELRTPIAVIQTSLENLGQNEGGAARREIYLERASGGLARLARILSAMSEASGLEASIRINAKIPVDLVPLLREVFGAYQSVYTGHHLTLALPDDEAMTLAAPDLLVQALDKFMDNAASFCPAQGQIGLRLLESAEHWHIEVTNEGPALPEEMQGQLFHSMVSVREKGDEDIHLGLGLHIVQLIADFHDAELALRNLPDGEGVASTISLHKIRV